MEIVKGNYELFKSKGCARFDQKYFVYLIQNNCYEFIRKYLLFDFIVNPQLLEKYMPYIKSISKDTYWYKYFNDIDDFGIKPWLQLNYLWYQLGLTFESFEEICNFMNNFELSALIEIMYSKSKSSFSYNSFLNIINNHDFFSFCCYCSDYLFLKKIKEICTSFNIIITDFISADVEEEIKGLQLHQILENKFHIKYRCFWYHYLRIKYGMYNRSYDSYSQVKRFEKLMNESIY